MNNRAGPQRRLFAAGRESVSLGTLGLTFAFSVLVGFGIGYGLDRLLHTSPFLMIAFILLGLASGIVNLVRAARVLSSQ
jgi:F0F1-type ATP synthase assembly protein I